MMEFQLGNCTRLCARISEIQCKKNRSNGVFACDGCAGLTGIEPVKYTPESLPEKMSSNDDKLSYVIVRDEIPAPVKESTMSKKVAVRGTCPICKRDDVTMTQTKEPKCFRCYDRIRKGYDPLGTVPIGPGKKQSAAEPPVSPAILAGDETETGSNTQNNEESTQNHVLQTAVQTEAKPVVERKKAKGATPPHSDPAETVTLEFTGCRDRDLLSRLFSIACEERRTIENQIFIALENYSSNHQSEAQ